MLDAYSKIKRNKNRRHYERMLKKLYKSLADSFIDEIIVKDSFLSYWIDRQDIIQNSAKFVLESSEEY